MLSPMLQQCSTGFVHLVFESLTFLIVFGGHDQSLERFDKPAIPERSYAEFSVQVFTIKAVRHERRITENREMDKRDFATQRFITLLAFSPGVTGRHPMISLITQHALLRQD